PRTPRSTRFAHDLDRRIAQRPSPTGQRVALLPALKTPTAIGGTPRSATDPGCAGGFAEARTVALPFSIVSFPLTLPLSRRLRNFEEGVARTTEPDPWIGAMCLRGRLMKNLPGRLLLSRASSTAPLGWKGPATHGGPILFYAMTH